MPIFVVIIVIFVLILTAYIIVHPNPMFENYWKLHSWEGEQVDKFTKTFFDNKVTFALGETRETILMIIENVEPMEFELDEISGSEVRSKTERNGLKFILNYDLLPYEHVKLTILESPLEFQKELKKESHIELKKESHKELKKELKKVAELIFVSIGAL